ncbi:MAG: preprotein translocase subunit SecE [Acidobacteria bacterium]|nr:preprotein translocase subunit SecE [Acidobacteriota bacterium]
MNSDTQLQPASFGQKVVKWPTQLRDYVDELRAEMRRVTWPSWTQVRATTSVVIVAVFMFAAYFFVVDAIVTKIITRILK